MKIKFRDSVSKDFFELVNGNYITSLSPLQVNCFKEGKNLYKGITITGFAVSVDTEQFQLIVLVYLDLLLLK